MKYCILLFRLVIYRGYVYIIFFNYYANVFWHQHTFVIDIFKAKVLIISNSTTPIEYFTPVHSGVVRFIGLYPTSPLILSFTSMKYLLLDVNQPTINQSPYIIRYSNQNFPITVKILLQQNPLIKIENHNLCLILISFYNLNICTCNNFNKMIACTRHI